MFGKLLNIRGADGKLNKKALLGKLAGLAIAAKIALSLGTFGWLIYSTVSDPMHVLPKPQSDVAASITPLPSPPGRRLMHVTLMSGKLKPVGFALNLPEPLPARKLPLLVVLGGLGTGENNIRTIPDAGNNAVIGYDWPIPVRLPNGWRLLWQLPELYSGAMEVPGQMTTALQWLQAQVFADDTRISLLGYSLGALAAPAIQDMAQLHGVRIGWTIIAYGGAPLGQLFASDRHIHPAVLRKMLGPCIDLLLRPLQPVLHLQRLTGGHFLVMEGENDALMPPDLRANLRNAVPEPKDVIVFPGDHMGVGPGKLELLRLIIDTSRSWLITNRAIDIQR